MRAPNDDEGAGGPRRLPGDCRGDAATTGRRLCRKAVLCLDTNYLSNLAKARSGLSLPAEAVPFWQELFSALEDAVWGDRIVCPGFDVQIEEAEFDDRIALPVWIVMRALSLGLQFHSRDSLIVRQVEDAAYRFLGRELPSRLPWEEAFQDDPDLPATELSRRARERPFMPPLHSPDVVARRRAEKEQRMSSLRSIVEGVNDSAAARQVESVKRTLLARWLAPNAFRDLIETARADRPPHDPERWQAAREYTGLTRRLEEAGLERTRMPEFLASKELQDIPYVDIYCHVTLAAARNAGKARLLRGSDESDRRIVSALLPSCSILTTDRFMKHILVDLLHYDEEYGCHVFSGRLDDVRSLTEAVRSLPRPSG
jgi:hypothetical protein